MYSISYSFLSFFFILLNFSTSFAQENISKTTIEIEDKNNLILNGSFEDLSDCPDDFGKLSLANGWASVHFTPDIFHRCAKNGKISVPSNFFGNQPPASGKGYAGLLAYHQSSPSEIISTTLKEPLIKGKKYTVSFKISLAEGYSNFACNNLGAVFTNDVAQALKEGKADVKATDVIKNSKTWVNISKTFYAEEEYQYLVIGNFYSATETTLEQIQTAAYPVAYYYIDDVEVKKVLDADDDENFVKVIGKVYDAETKNLIGVQSRIDFVLPDIKYRAFEITKDGSRYEFSNMQRAKRFYLEAKAKGYFSERVLVEGNDTSSIFIQDFHLQPVEVGSVRVLEDIHFDFNKATLKPESFPELNLLIAFLQDHRNYHVEISGHTDNIGNEDSNLKLSQARAESIVKYLIEHGFVNQKRMTFVGYGSSKPIASNDTEDGRFKNRRVELKIVKD